MSASDPKKQSCSGGFNSQSAHTSKMILSEYLKQNYMELMRLQGALLVNPGRVHVQLFGDFVLAGNHPPKRTDV